MTKYEYKSVRIKSKTNVDVDCTLNGFARDGWLLDKIDENLFIFKRILVTKKRKLKKC